MKKLMLPIAAFLLFAGVAGAQTAAKKTPAAPAQKETASAKRSAADHSLSSVTSATPAKTEEGKKAVTVKRKHHHKKAKPSAKTVSK